MSRSLARLSKWIRSVELKNEKEFVDELDLNMLWMAWDIQNLIDLIYTAEAIVHRYLENDHHEVLVGIDEFKLKLKELGEEVIGKKLEKARRG